MADIGWEALNDGDDDTFTHTTNVQHAFMELDFGPTGQVKDRVRVKHRAGGGVMTELVSMIGYMSLCVSSVSLAVSSF
jgi:hypothetical protein